MSYTKVTAMVFPMVVNQKSAPKDNNRYQRVMMSGDSPRDSDVDSMDSNNRESSVRYVMEPTLASSKINRGSQTDIMMIPPMYPAPPPPIQPSKIAAVEKRKVRSQDFQGDIKNEIVGIERNHFNAKVEIVNQSDLMDNAGERRLSRCEHCSQLTCSTPQLDTPIDNEPVTGADSASGVSSAGNSERQRNQQEQPEDSCAMECLYYAVQCSDCTLL
ncbi:uncharacterized protein LOC124167211 [Ischnura elegans]|uniref:uncharacterized protein LOC124167211 n=1 Tax=Ischnura elegans TaxID=197161 RepID=UPI001ED88032|nr:uncharacterized protein LOC124167211 [Ischnura elegans]